MKQHMMLYATADPYPSLGANKPMDVLEGWHNYMERLEKNRRSIMRPEDAAVIAGGIPWAMKLEETEKDLASLHLLPGRKLLLKGNHDHWWSIRSKVDTYLAAKGLDSLQIVHNGSYPVGQFGVCDTHGWLYNAASGEDIKVVNRETGRLNASIDHAMAQGFRPIMFLHYPPVYDGMVCKEVLEVLISRGIRKCYFGHIHGTQAPRRAVAGEYQGIELHLISCDYPGFAPLLVCQVNYEHFRENMEYLLPVCYNK